MNLDQRLHAGIWFDMNGDRTVVTGLQDNSNSGGLT